MEGTSVQPLEASPQTPPRLWSVVELRKIWVLLLRGFKQAIRPYAALMPEFIMPLFFFVVNSSAFQRVVELPGFATETYLLFYAPVALLTAIFVSSGSAGIEIVTDISTGFMDRLFVAPVNRWYIVFAKLAAIGLKAAMLTGLMMALFTLFGARYEGGWLAPIVVLAFAFVFGMGWSGIGIALAFITKNPRTVQASFIIFFPFSFITTAQLPLNLLEGWYKVAVQVNPVTYILEGIRAVLIDGNFGMPLVLGFAVALGFAAATLSLATWAFKRSVLK